MRYAEKLLRFSERRGQRENGDLVQGEERRANLLTAITGVRKYNVVNSTFSRTDFRPFLISSPLSLSLSSLSLPRLSFRLSQAKVSAIQLTRQAISASSPWCLIESQSYLLNPLAHDKFDKSDLTKSSADVTFWD